MARTRMTRPAVSSKASTQCRRAIAPSLMPRQPACRRPGRWGPVVGGPGGAAAAGAWLAGCPSAIARSRMNVILGGGYRLTPSGSLTGRRAVLYLKAGMITVEHGGRRRGLGENMPPAGPPRARREVAGDSGNAEGPGRDQGHERRELVAPAELEHVGAEQHPHASQERD